MSRKLDDSVEALRRDLNNIDIQYDQLALGTKNLVSDVELKVQICDLIEDNNSHWLLENDLLDREIVKLKAEYEVLQEEKRKLIDMKDRRSEKQDNHSRHRDHRHSHHHHHHLKDPVTYEKSYKKRSCFNDLSDDANKVENKPKRVKYEFSDKTHYHEYIKDNHLCVYDLCKLYQIKRDDGSAIHCFNVHDDMVYRHVRDLNTGMKYSKSAAIIQASKFIIQRAKDKGDNVVKQIIKCIKKDEEGYFTNDEHLLNVIN